MTTQVATDIEILVIRWLDRRGIQYEFQTSLAGGWYSLGGSVVDFLFRDRSMVWRVMGEYYHRGVTKEGSDLYHKEILEQLGFIVVDIWGDDIRERIDETLGLALQGREMLR